MFAGIAILLLTTGALIGRTSADTLQPWQGPLPPPFALTSHEGVRLALSDAADRIAIVHFFATWCEPCVPELGALERLVGAMPQQRLALFLISVGEPGVRVRRFLDKHKFQLTVLLDPDRSTMKAWQAAILPTSFVLGPRLTPLWHAEGPVEWDDETVRARLKAALAAPDKAQ